MFARGLGALVLTALLAVAFSVPAQSAKAPTGTKTTKPSKKKSIWGPVRDPQGRSMFPSYRKLGAGIYQTQLQWAKAAKQQPADPFNPDDPAYTWPADLDFAVAEAAKNGMTVSLLVKSTPPWANGGKSIAHKPDDPSQYAAFLQAASRRYRSVRHWMVWGEPTRKANWLPLKAETKRNAPLDAEQAEAPRNYAVLLDEAYGALKAVDPRNLVIGGNTFTSGDISPRNWIANLKLPDGRPPRMDLFGHNPFTGRRPDIRKPPLAEGFADLCDLDTLYGWIDRDLIRGGRNAGIKLFLSEFTLPTDHSNNVFNFHVSRKTQADWLRAALRLVRADKRFYTLGWYQIQDQPPRPDNRQANWGLVDAGGKRKPAYAVFAKG